MKEGTPIKVLGIWVLTLATVAGCQVQPRDSISKAGIRFEVVPSQAVYVPQVEAHVAGDGLVIRGKVRRTPDNCCNTTRGTLSILLVGPDGEVVDTVTTSPTPRQLPKAGTRSSGFSATLPYVPTEEFRLRIAYRPD